MTKGKCHSSSLLKAFQIRLFFNSSIFHFIGTLICSLLRFKLKFSGGGGGEGSGRSIERSTS